MAGRAGTGQKEIDYNKLLKSAVYCVGVLRLREAMDSRLSGVTNAAIAADAVCWAATADLYRLIDWLHQQS